VNLPAADVSPHSPPPSANGATHRYYRANWLGPLRHRRRVPLEKGKSVAPSAESLANLLREQKDLLKLAFLNRTWAVGRHAFSVLRSRQGVVKIGTCL